MKKKVIIVVVLIAVASCLAFAVAASRQPSESKETVHLNGRIETTTVDLGPKVAGRVANVLVREGDRVKAGDLLVVLDLGETTLAVERDKAGVRSAAAHLDDLEAGSRSAEISAATAEVEDRKAAVVLSTKDEERQAVLLAKGIGSPQDHDRAQTALDRAKAALKASEQRLELAREGSRRDQTAMAKAERERAEAMLEQSVLIAKESEIRAPADGVIMHRLAEPGQLVAAGQSAITMAFAGRLFVRTFIPETSLGKVRTGEKVTVKVDAYPDRIFAATITEISPDSEFTPKVVETSEERVNLVYGAKAELDGAWSEPLVPGQPADVTVGIE